MFSTWFPQRNPSEREREQNRMMRVVDVLPGREEIAAAGLVKKNFRIDPDAYGYFVEQYRQDYLAFERTKTEEAVTANGSAVLHRTARVATPDEACIEAFDRSRPPYHYHLGSIYRYRIDRMAPAGRPIILESLERSEITGSLLGLPFTSQRQGLLMRFCLWLEERLREREERGKG
jgi:hypothetical protein